MHFRKNEWIMKILEYLVKNYHQKQSNQNKKVLLCTHATDATIELIRSLIILGIDVFYWPIDYSQNRSCMQSILNIKDVFFIREKSELRDHISDIDIIIEDGMRISRLLHNEFTNVKLQPNIYSMEQTTNGIRYLEDNLLSKDLRYPVINIAESQLKTDIENLLATPESILSTISFKNNISLIQKRILIIGYGQVGKGLARMCSLHGSNVIISEIDPVKRMLAESNGFLTIIPKSMNEIIPFQDVIISCTSSMCSNSIDVEQVLLMKDGAVIFNAGGGYGEISTKLLQNGTFDIHQAKITISKKNDHITCLLEKSGMVKTVKILASGYPINLRIGTGNSNNILDLVFSSMILTILKVNPNTLCPRLSVR